MKQIVIDWQYVIKTQNVYLYNCGIRITHKIINIPLKAFMKVHPYQPKCIAN